MTATTGVRMGCWRLALATTARTMAAAAAIAGGLLVAGCDPCLAPSGVTVEQGMVSLDGVPLQRGLDAAALDRLLRGDRPAVALGHGAAAAIAASAELDPVDLPFRRALIHERELRPLPRL